MNLCKDCRYYRYYSSNYSSNYRFDDCTNISAMVSIDEVTGYISYKTCSQMRRTKCEAGVLFEPSKVYKLKQLFSWGKP